MNTDKSDTREAPELAQWNEAAMIQFQILAKLSNEKQHFEEELESVKFDNWNLKTTLKSMVAEAEKREILMKQQQAKIEHLQLQTEPRKTESGNLVLVLVDGDGYIFSPELMNQGEEGGKMAASKLLEGITDYICLQKESPKHPTILVMIFLAKEGLLSMLRGSGVCTPELFSKFMDGFTQAHPLFSFVDVGAYKEGADHKIREYLSTFIRTPQTFKVILGVCHDNGYGGALSAILTAGFKDRLVLLKGYQKMAKQIENLSLPNISINNLFLDEKIPEKSSPLTPSSYANMAATISQAKSPLLKQRTIPLTKESEGSPRKQGEGKNHKRNPAPCNHHYLGGGCFLTNCTYGHEYELTTQEIDSLKQGALNAPCRWINEDKECLVKNCFLGHKCPRGSNCFFHERGQCKFKGVDMHKL